MVRYCILCVDIQWTIILFPVISVILVLAPGIQTFHVILISLTFLLVSSSHSLTSADCMFQLPVTN